MPKEGYDKLSLLFSTSLFANPRCLQYHHTCTNRNNSIDLLLIAIDVIFVGVEVVSGSDVGFRVIVVVVAFRLAVNK